jgi:hypothetical protein
VFSTPSKVGDGGQQKKRRKTTKEEKKKTEANEVGRKGSSAGGGQNKIEWMGQKPHIELNGVSSNVGQISLFSEICHTRISPFICLPDKDITFLLLLKF